MSSGWLDWARVSLGAGLRAGSEETRALAEVFTPRGGQVGGSIRLVLGPPRRRSGCGLTGLGRFELLDQVGARRRRNDRARRDRGDDGRRRSVIERRDLRGSTRPQQPAPTGAARWKIRVLRKPQGPHPLPIQAQPLCPMAARPTRSGIRPRDFQRRRPPGAPRAGPPLRNHRNNVMILSSKFSTSRRPVRDASVPAAIGLRDRPLTRGTIEPPANRPDGRAGKKLGHRNRRDRGRSYQQTSRSRRVGKAVENWVSALEMTRLSDCRSSEGGSHQFALCCHSSRCGVFPRRRECQAPIALVGLSITETYQKETDEPCHEPVGLFDLEECFRCCVAFGPDPIIDPEERP